MITVIYRIAGNAVLNSIDIKALNEFDGADIEHLQVLKGEKGFYIGELRNIGKPSYWTQYKRNSSRYWQTREAAEEAFRKNNYKLSAIR